MKHTCTHILAMFRYILRCHNCSVCVHARVCARTCVLVHTLLVSSGQRWWRGREYGERDGEDREGSHCRKKRGTQNERREGRDRKGKTQSLAQVLDPAGPEISLPRTSQRSLPCLLKPFSDVVV